MIRYPHTVAEMESNPWTEITEERADDLLGAVPPAAMDGPAFAVGEELSHLDDNRPVYDCVMQVDDRWFSKPYTLDRFDPAAFEREIRVQIG